MKISIINPGGVTNMGEQAIMIGTVNELRQLHPKAEIRIFGYKAIDEYLAGVLDKKDIQRTQELISARSFAGKLIHIAQLIVAPKTKLGTDDYSFLKESDIVISKGQETLTESYGFVHFIDSFLEQALVARRINPHVVLFGQSIGPVKKHRRIARWHLQKMEKIYSRDSISSGMLKSLGITHYEQREDVARSAFPAKQSKRARGVLIVPNQAINTDAGSRQAYEAKLVALIDFLVKKGNHPITLTSTVLASDWNDDYSLCESIRHQRPDDVVVKKLETLKDFIDLARNSQAVISSRLHPLILSDEMDVPIICFSEAPKVVGMFPESPFIHPFTELTAAERKHLSAIVHS